MYLGFCREALVWLRDFKKKALYLITDVEGGGDEGDEGGGDEGGVGGGDKRGDAAEGRAKNEEESRLLELVSRGIVVSKSKNI